MHLGAIDDPVRPDLASAHDDVGLRGASRLLAQRGVRDTFEQMAVRSPQVQHRYAPVAAIGVLVVHGEAAGGDGVFERKAAGERLVEALAERNRRGVFDRILVCDDGGDVDLGERRCDPAPDAEALAPSGLAAGEHGQPDLLPAQVDAQLFGIDPLILERQHASTRVGARQVAHLTSEVAVAGEMENMSARHRRL